MSRMNNSTMLIALATQKNDGLVTVAQEWSDASPAARHRTTWTRLRHLTDWSRRGRRTAPQPCTGAPRAVAR